MTLALGFSPRARRDLVVVASRRLKSAFIHYVATRRKNSLAHSHRGLKPTAKIIAPLRGGKPIPCQLSTSPPQPAHRRAAYRAGTIHARARNTNKPPALNTT